MQITCENESRTNNIKGSIVTIKADDGTVVEEIHMPVRYGADYCEKHPTGKYGRQFQEAIEKAKGKRPTRAKRAYTRRNTDNGTATQTRSATQSVSVGENTAEWLTLDLDTPPKKGDYWVSDGKKVWSLNIAKPSQVPSLVSIMGIQYYKPITEKKPRLKLAS